MWPQQETLSFLLMKSCTIESYEAGETVSALDAGGLTVPAAAGEGSSQQQVFLCLGFWI